MGLEEKSPSGLRLITVEKMSGYARKNLLRLWRPPLRPGESRSRGCSAPRNLAEAQAIRKTMPLDAWMAVQDRAAHPYQSGHPGLAAS